MKKFLLLALMFFVASCATLYTNKHPQLTIEKVQKTCPPAESFRLDVMGLTAYAVIADDCSSVKRLLVIGLDAEESEEMRKHSLKILELRFIGFMNERPNRYNADAPEPGTVKWSIRKLKKETNKNWVSHFYELTYKKVK